MSDPHDILTQADLAVYDAEPGTQLTHVGACLAAIASIGGDPATVGELVAAVLAVDALICQSHGVAGLHLNGDVADWPSLMTGGRFEDWLHPLCAVLAKLPENSND